MLLIWRYFFVYLDKVRGKWKDSLLNRFFRVVMYFGVLNNGYFILIVNVNFFKSGFKKGEN